MFPKREPSWLPLSSPRYSPSTGLVSVMTDFADATGNLLEADVDALVNTVNTVGVMGKGIALQFKNVFPANFKAYERACRDRQVRLGKMFVFDAGQLLKPRWIINFPTKGHWRSSSNLADVASGLDDLRRVITELGIKSIAVPPLGCGNGGLEWADVRPLVEAKLADLDIEVLVFVPDRTPAAPDVAAVLPAERRAALDRMAVIADAADVYERTATPKRTR